MKVARSLEEFRRLCAAPRHAVTIGNFDGVHLGHQELIRVTRDRAATAGVPAVALTFDPHPACVLRGAEPAAFLTPLPRKLELLAATGLDATLVLPFTPALAAMTATEFVRQVLVSGMGASHLVTGYNFALGNNRDGSLPALKSLGTAHGVTLTQVPPVVVTGLPVSSSRVREHVRSGDVHGATALLGRMHTVQGGVTPGKQRGRTIGFPTANVAHDATLLPPPGAYATWLSFPGGTGALLPSMTSVGTNPTFGPAAMTIETHIFDFSDTIYGKTVRVHFARHLRGQATFSGAEALKAQLTHDALAARAALEEAGGKDALGPEHGSGGA